MDNVLFKARLNAGSDGEWDYFCAGGVGYRDHDRNPFAWKVIDGKVMFRSISGFSLFDGSSEPSQPREVWAADSDEVQLAYQQWIAKLVTE